MHQFDSSTLTGKTNTQIIIHYPFILVNVIETKKKEQKNHMPMMHMKLQF